MEKITSLVGRAMLAVMFLQAGIGKLGAYAGTQQYMVSMGVPGWLLPLVITLEIGGAVALIVGWQTRWAALARDRDPLAQRPIRLQSRPHPQPARRRASRPRIDPAP